jgi:hypothetical protein
MHSSIERAKHHGCVYTTNEWMNIMRIARVKNPYCVVPLEYDDFLDFKQIHGMYQNLKFDNEGKPVKWSKVICIRCIKAEPTIIMVKYDFDEDYHIVPLTKRQTVRKQHVPTSPIPDGPIPQLYTSMLTISEAKKKDLTRLCDEHIIPQQYHEWYLKIPSDECVADKLAEPNEDESDCDSS